MQLPPQNLARAHGGDHLIEIGQKWLETFSLWGGLSTKDRILDIGCGPGRMAFAIREHYNWRDRPRYAGFDIKHRDIRFCKRAFRWSLKFEFHLLNVFNDHYNPRGVGSAESVKFPARDGSATFCIATSVFTHFYRAEVAHYLAEAHRCLSPGGRLFSTWFLLEDLPKSGTPRFTFSFVNDDGTKSEVDQPRRRAIAFNKEAAISLLSEAGFDNIVLHRGGWRRDQRNARHSQDVIVASRC